MNISNLPSPGGTRVNSFVEAVSSNQSGGLSEESVSTHLSSSVCDKPLPPEYCLSGEDWVGACADNFVIPYLS